MHPFRAAAQTGDITPIKAMLAPEVKLYSPVPYRPFEGRDAVWRILQTLWSITDEIEYTDELTGPDSIALISRVRIGGRDGQALQLLRFDTDGRIASITDMLRPQSAVKALIDAISSAPPLR
jgi:SnoaL-like domain